MDWAAIIVAVVAALTAIYTAQQGSQVKRRSQQIEQQKVDAEAYERAKKYTDETVLRFEKDIRYLQNQLDKTRAKLEETERAREETESRYEAELKKARDEWGVLERYFRRRIKKLEDALRDSGVPVPNGDTL